MENKKFETEKYSFDAPADLLNKIEEINNTIRKEYEITENKEKNAILLLTTSIQKGKITFFPTEITVHVPDKVKQHMIDNLVIPYCCKRRITKGLYEDELGQESYTEYYLVYGRNEYDCISVIVLDNKKRYHIDNTSVSNAFCDINQVQCGKEEFDLAYNEAVEHFKR